MSYFTYQINLSHPDSQQKHSVTFTQKKVLLRNSTLPSPETEERDKRKRRMRNAGREM